MLNSMQILPLADITHPTDSYSTGEKRKDSNLNASKSQPKKTPKANRSQAAKKIMPTRGSVGGPRTLKTQSKSTDVPMDI